MSSAAGALSQRHRQLLEGPVLPAMLRLAAPNFLLAAMQAGATAADAYFVGRIGTVPLAGLALVFPLIALMQMMSAGAIGGGVSSAVARAVGAGDYARASAIALQAVYLALACGLAFSAILLLGGRGLYQLLGGKAAVVDAALVYSNAVFAGACLVWIANTLANLLRGAGNMLAAAIGLSMAAVVQIVLSGALTLGLGPFPRLGLLGTALAYLAGFGLASVVLGIWFARELGRWGVRIVVVAPDRKLSWEILRVGLLSSLNAFQTIVTAVILTGLVGSFGAAALAGYGLGARLELLQVPFVFAVGAALVAMVGINVGAGRPARARRIAWIGGMLGAAITGSVGIIVALWPHWWAGMFSSDPEVLAAGHAYLRIVGPCYVFLGAGMALYFAAQGVGRVLAPVLASTARLAIVAVGGYLLVHVFGAGLEALYLLVALGMTVFGLGVVAAIARGVFRAPC